jgi:hypothetical protein
VNQDGAAVQTNAGTTFLSKTPTANGWSLRLKSVPTAPYTVTVSMKPASAQTGNRNFAAIVLRNSGGNSFIEFGAFTSSGNFGVNYSKWTNVTTFSADYFASGNNSLGGHQVFYRIQDDNTNRIASMSMDGVNYIQLHSVSRTDFLTPDQIGIGIWTTGTSSPNLIVGMMIQSWDQ